MVVLAVVCCSWLLTEINGWWLGLESGAMFALDEILIKFGIQYQERLSFACVQ